MTSEKSTNPSFLEFAAALREAAEQLKRAADTAANGLYYPQMDFSRVRRHLESLAVCAEHEKLRLAYVKHNTLTDAPAHPRRLGRVRVVRETSERKKRSAIENGRKGGRSDSDLKKAAARGNGKRGGRPPGKWKRKLPEPVVPVKEPIAAKITQTPTIRVSAEEPIAVNITQDPTTRVTPLDLPFGEY